jgi:hypothetical protein
MSPDPRSQNSLVALARALGGEAYAGGLRANVPAPGHAAADRSVSLLLVDGRVVAHGFGAHDWREILGDLRRRGWIDSENRLLGSGASVGPPPAPAAPTAAERLAAAARLWAEGGPIGAQHPAALYGWRRGVALDARLAGALRAHSAVPAAVYRNRGPRRPALLAAVLSPTEELTAVEVTYLDAQGRRSALARPPRKSVGVLPPGSAVRLAPAADELLVGEGVFTTLSAMARFGLPGWALLSAGNLHRWSPPPDVRRVVIAGDRGQAGEQAGQALRARLEAAGVAAALALPPPGYGDWNDLDQEEVERKGGEGRPARGGGP